VNLRVFLFIQDLNVINLVEHYVTELIVRQDGNPLSKQGYQTTVYTAKVWQRRYSNFLVT
jgi:hypothetical protein